MAASRRLFIGASGPGLDDDDFVGVGVSTDFCGVAVGKAFTGVDFTGVAGKLGVTVGIEVVVVVVDALVGCCVVESSVR